MKIIRVGEKNNFNFTTAELAALKFYEQEGKLFVNSNSFVKITADYPSIITINPYLSFVEPKGDLSRVLAYRAKLMLTDDPDICREQQRLMQFVAASGVPILVTFFRIRRKDVLNKYITAPYKTELYKFNAGWYRPTLECRNRILERFVYPYITDVSKILLCDMAGTGCLDCGNCVRLMGGTSADEVYSLNLSCSGDEGKCMFNCPECWATVVLAMAAKQRPLCDHVFRNRKQKGIMSHV